MKKDICSDCGCEFKNSNDNVVYSVCPICRNLSDEKYANQIIGGISEINPEFSKFTKRDKEYFSFFKKIAPPGLCGLDYVDLLNIAKDGKDFKLIQIEFKDDNVKNIDLKKIKDESTKFKKCIVILEGGNYFTLYEGNYILEKNFYPFFSDNVIYQMAIDYNKECSIFKIRCLLIG